MYVDMEAAKHTKTTRQSSVLFLTNEEYTKIILLKFVVFELWQDTEIRKSARTQNA